MNLKPGHIILNGQKEAIQKLIRKSGSGSPCAGENAPIAEIEGMTDDRTPTQLRMLGKVVKNTAGGCFYSYQPLKSLTGRGVFS